jgi:hypothetical protein
MRLKPRNRSKAAEAAADSTPALKGGACVSLFGHVKSIISLELMFEIVNQSFV